MRRDVRIARSVGRPSRRKKLPGMRPAAYMRSSTSTVRGNKAMPSRIERAPLAVTSTWVLPSVATTEPWLWNANLPVSKLREVSVPDVGPDTTMGSAICRSPLRRFVRRVGAAGPVPSRQPPLVSEGGDWQLTFAPPDSVVTRSRGGSRAEYQYAAGAARGPLPSRGPTGGGRFLGRSPGRARWCLVAPSRGGGGGGPTGG